MILGEVYLVGVEREIKVVEDAVYMGYVRLGVCVGECS